MPRKLTRPDDRLTAEIEAAWTREQPAWARRRLLVVRLVARENLAVAEIMKAAGVSRQTVFTYRRTLLSGGVTALLKRGKAPGARSIVTGAVEAELARRLAAGQLRQVRKAQAWIQRRTGKKLTESAVRRIIRRLQQKPDARNHG